VRQNRGLRVLRGVLAASAATFIALLSHVAGGGGMPAIVGIAVPWVFSVLVCTALAGRALSFARLTVAVSVSQLLFHTLFVIGFVAAPASPMGAHDHGHGLMSVADIAVTATLADGITADGTMWLWHGFAAVITTLVVHRGERTVLALLAAARGISTWARRVLVRALPALERHDAPSAPPIDALPLPRPAPLFRTLQRRGPPLFV